MEALLLDKCAVKAEVPVDMNTAAFVGARVAMKDAIKLAIIVNMGDSVGAVVDFTLKQHNASVGGTSKALSIMNPYFKKAGAATAFTKVVPTVAASNYVLSADFAAEEGVVIFEICPEDLDVEGNFTHVSIEAADSTAAKLMSVVHVAHKVKVMPAHEVAL